MAGTTSFNGMVVKRSGYWTDRHGHRVYVCAEDVMPACPRYPFGTTRWTLETEIGCRYRRQERRAA